MESRNQIFQRLKPQCVALSQKALALNGPRGDVKSVSDELLNLKKILSDIPKNANALDEKLADYVFFPLSQVLKLSQKVSVRCLELSLQCLSILIEHGWRARLQPQLAGQMLILCTLLAEKQPKGLGIEDTTNELQESAFDCLRHIFIVIEADSETRQALIAESSVPQLGQTISVVLDGMEEGGAPEVQIVAGNALKALLERIATPEIQASFLPGIVSKLTKVVASQKRQRRHPRVLTCSLDILASLFTSILADVRNPGLANETGLHQDQELENGVMSKSWFETAATQLKPALSTIFRLKDHSRDDVRESLARLCLIILRECKLNLANCAAPSLSTLVFLSSGLPGSSIKSTLDGLAREDSGFPVLLQDTIYQSLQSLPTSMQSSDTGIKVQRLDELYTSYSSLKESGNDSTMLDKYLAKALSESVVVTLLPSTSIKTDSGTPFPVQSLDLAMPNLKQSSRNFSSIIQTRGQEDVINKIEQLAELIGSSTSPLFCDDLVRTLHGSRGDMQIASFWLLLSATKASIEKEKSMDQYIDIGAPVSEANLENLENLYSFALSTLTDSSDENKDVRLRSLALRALALQAQVSKHDFRYELIDTLYPVLFSLATPNEVLQSDSIVTLDIFGSACGYDNVKDLIVQNVDYLTNAVALKLNAFDVSPQAPQVLLMMVRLAGPALLPYLEDTIESIFAALEDYHGYPLLVELLFKVLSVVAEEGTKASQLAITHPSGLDLTNSLQTRSNHLTMTTLIGMLRERAEQSTHGPPETSTRQQSHPHRPWKSDEDAKDGQSDDGDDPESPGNADEQDRTFDDVEIPPPAPKTYGILLKITELTQHFLPSASPSLRTSLLALIKTTTPALARHENSFLPLINTLWPEISSRLDDREPHILAAALDVAAALCEHAGDFMRSRILQLWPRVMEIDRQQRQRQRQHHAGGSGRRQEEEEEPRVHALGSGSNNGRSSSGAPRGRESFGEPNSSPLSALVSRDSQAGLPGGAVGSCYDSSSERVREALAGFMGVVVRCVDPSPEVFDEALWALRSRLDRPAVLSALEAGNADAVWLVRMRAGAVPVPSLPVVDGSRGWKFASVPV